MTVPRRIYPSWLKQPYDKNSHDLAETLGRLADRTDAWKREEQERIAALAWCRANGNPHIRELEREVLGTGARAQRARHALRALRTSTQENHP